MRSGSERLAIAAGAVALLAAGGILFHLRSSRAQPRVTHVVIVSLDGLSSDAVQALGPVALPTLHRLAWRGAFTLNARADPNSTETLANHLSMMTGLPLSAHGYSDNTLEARAPKKITCESLFDVVHRSGKRAALVSSKKKFLLYGERWRGAIDRVDVTDRDDDATLAAWIAIMRERDPALSFLHLAAIDRAGHAKGWDLSAGSPYTAAVRETEALIATLIQTIDHDPALRDHTAIILTSDHGGRDRNHVDAKDRAMFTVPLIVMSPATAGGDLYALNAGIRADPGLSRTSTSSVLPPISSADVANAALGLLGLPAVPGSTANVRQDMYFGAPAPLR